MRIHCRWMVLALGLPIILASAAMGAASAPDPDAGARKAWHILFVNSRLIAERPQKWTDDIWISNGDGSGRRLLINNGERPSWSPDHKRFAFFRDANLWLANADGSGQVQVTTRWKPADAGYSQKYTSRISWGPLPGRVVFSRPGAGVLEAFLGPGGGQLRELFGGEDGGIGDTCPVWSPSGEHLAWAREGDIWIARRNMAIAPGGDGDRTPYPWSYTRLAAVARYDYATDHGSMWGYGATHIAWSPNGNLLAYGMNRYGGSGIDRIRLMRLFRTGKEYEVSDMGLEVVTDYEVTEEGRDPCFSPDGQRIVYCYDGDIRITTLDGKWSHVLFKGGEQPCL